eukprot:CAMPEP_0203661652 /NCGR_PEP_ID=MMETSP0088-20131115/59725_1 /ASSEMBLY_ACC=CAM_ASM_001087 /TAXON_ID=426623 /ORGANISM="Chaetoceros affinis, Strain CCMP159" /LENGTH=271 /DNA_ID=CAMNT_0050524339 /DNA_START=19 /DNA_END=834 /DNA_ORIENTATION=+
MKIIPSVCALLLATSCDAFTAPRTSFGVVPSTGKVVLNMAEDKVPFFASSPTPGAKDEPTIDDEVDELVKEEVAKTKRISNLRNANGVDYAPWMNMSAEDEEKIRSVMKEKAEARRKRQLQEKSVSGNLYYDSQAQELSGTGLNSKVIDGQVELEWATRSEKNTAGFIVKKRPAKTEDFSVIASYEDWGPLVSKGSEGGVYRFLDTETTPGGWVYRITECDQSGNEADLCQGLIEVQTEEEQKAALIAGVGIGVLLVGAVVAGLVLDPYAN